MRNIENIKSKKKEMISKIYYKKSFKDLDENKKHNIIIIAEYLAYIDVVIPSGFEKMSIFDLDGFASKNVNESEQLLDSKTVINARNSICKYCWNKQWKDIDIDSRNDKDYYAFHKKYSEHCVLDKRLDQGSNVVIYGESDEPKGRTLCASILMKEIIGLRFSNKFRGHTYNWVDFSVLKNLIKKDSNEVSEYLTCDWLVVDNINKYMGNTARQNSYIADLINPFFIERFSDRLPVILVFKFDIRKQTANLSKELGDGIYSIIKSKRTFDIPLTNLNY